METMQMLARLALLFALVMLNTQCNLSHNKSLNKADIEGAWSEKEDPEAIQFTGSNHTFQFLSDNTFLLKRRFWSLEKSIDPNQKCASDFTEFIKGNYHINYNAILLEGNYFDQDFQERLLNCHGEKDFSLKLEASLNGNALFIEDEVGRTMKMIRP